MGFTAYYFINPSKMDNTTISTPKGANRQARKVEDFNQYVEEGMKFVRERLYVLATTPDPKLDKFRDNILYSLSNN